MHRRVVAVASAAMQCYLEMTSVVAQRFGDTLGHRGLMPVQFYGVMSYRPVPPTGALLLLPQEPGGRWLLKPAGIRQANGDRVGDNSVSITVNDEARAAEILDHKDLLYSEFLRYLDVFPAYAPFSGAFRITSGQIDVLRTRPATRIALQWLWDDLSELGWVSGLLPQLRE
jgi:hypothetical protein